MSIGAPEAGIGFSSKEKEADKQLLSVLVNKLYSIGIVISDLIGDSQLVQNHVVKNPPVKILDTDLLISYKSRKWIEPKSEEVVFEDQDGKKYSFLATAVEPINPQEIEEWKDYGKLPEGFEVLVDLGSQKINLTVRRDYTGKIAVSMVSHADPKLIQLALNMLEAIEDFFNSGFQTIPIAKDEKDEPSADDTVKAIFPDGGIIINPKYAI